MTDRPIIFSAPMVRALLDGRKTQTRRLAWRISPDDCDTRAPNGRPSKDQPVPTHWQRVQPGDRLWVREKWWVVEREDQGIGRQFVIYDDEWDAHGDGAEPLASAPLRPCHGWRFGPHPSIHMPRWASRITLVVTEARRQRLQEISIEDAIAEGIDTEGPDYNEGEALASAGSPVPPERFAFASLWQRLHGTESWAANPEVIALTFTVHKQNIDAMERAAA